MTAISARLARPLNWRSLIADIVLAGLLLGPLAAPLLWAWGLLIPREVSGIIYTMGTFVCPQPAQAVALYDGNLMAVCMRCYATVLGLLLTRLWYAAERRGILANGRLSSFWLPRHGPRALPIFATMIFAYPAEFAGQVVGLWRFDSAVVTIAGLITGVGLGLMFHPVLHDRRFERRDEC
jgi:uncharacterized membrane protein